MAILISDDEFNDIRASIRDVTDTFLRKVIVYKHKTVKSNRAMMDINKKAFYDDYNINTLIVMNDGTRGGSEFEFTINGAVDRAEGYALLNFDELQEQNLVDVMENFVPGAMNDFVFFNDEMKEVIAVVRKGQLKDKDCVIKVYFKTMAKSA